MELNVVEEIVHNERMRLVVALYEALPQKIRDKESLSEFCKRMDAGLRRKYETGKRGR